MGSEFYFYLLLFHVSFERVYYWMSKIATSAFSFWRWMFRSKQCGEHTELSERLAPKCDLNFEFKPTDTFLMLLGSDAQFIVVDPLDLLLQERGLMADALVVEAVVGDKKSILWFRYDTSDLATRGAAECTLFADDADRVFDGVCGSIARIKRA